MMSSHTLLVLMVVVVITACQPVQSVRSDEGPPVEEVLAKLVGFRKTDEGVVFDVVSTGCTTDRSVKPVVERIDDSTVGLTLLRIKPDRCRRAPMAKRIVYSRHELDIADEDIVLRNPIGKLPGRKARG